MSTLNLPTVANRLLFLGLPLAHQLELLWKSSHCKESFPDLGRVSLYSNGIKVSWVENGENCTSLDNPQPLTALSDL